MTLILIHVEIIAARLSPYFRSRIYHLCKAPVFGARRTLRKYGSSFALSAHSPVVKVAMVDTLLGLIKNMEWGQLAAERPLQHTSLFLRALIASCRAFLSLTCPAAQDRMESFTCDFAALRLLTTPRSFYFLLGVCLRPLPRLHYTLVSLYLHRILPQRPLDQVHGVAIM